MAKSRYTNIFGLPTTRPPAVANVNVAAREAEYVARDRAALIQRARYGLDSIRHLLPDEALDDVDDIHDLLAELETL